MKRSISPDAYRRITLLALAALCVIVVSGAAVRLTGSGLGCPTWPSCEEDSLVPESATDGHAMVEFVNRAFTGVVSLAVAGAVLGSLRRTPRRRDLTLLSLGLVAGVAGQIVLGGLTVLFDLTPPLVIAHFLVSVVLVANAVVLHHRAGEPDGGSRAPVAARQVQRAGTLLVGAATVVISTGTVVTGSGPHGGDADVDRLPFAVTDVARVHGLGEVCFLVAILVTARLVRRTGAPAHVQRDLTAVLVIAAAQGLIGYVQYFAGVPVVLVGMHVAGAMAVWIAVLRFRLRLTRTTSPAEVPPPDVPIRVAT